MKKLIFLFVSIVFLAVATQAQSQSSNTINTQTQEIQKVSTQVEGAVVTEQSTLKTNCTPSPNCNPSHCKKAGTSCGKNKASTAKDDASSQIAVTENNKSISNSEVVESKLQTVTTEVAKEQSDPKK